MVERLRRIPVVGTATVRTFWRVIALLRNPGRFDGTKHYWRRRYERGGNSGAGSYGKFARFKAEVVNGFVARERVRSVIEFGCGDGNQLRLARYPRYAGYDISEQAIARCREQFGGDRTKRFLPMHEYAGETAELALSLDVVYHLVEDATYEAYMRTLFDAAERFVIVYSSNTNDNRGFEGTHIRHRTFTDWVAAERPEWTLRGHIPNRYPFDGLRDGSFADFHIFGRRRPPHPEPASD
jgi:SAM-dependent methyltransferase